MRCAIYVRVSTLDQQVDNQLIELRRYVVARAWSAVEYVDHGVSGAKDRRPALDALLKDARRRKFDVLVCWRLDRLGRNLKHLITMLESCRRSAWRSCRSRRGSMQPRRQDAFRCTYSVPSRSSSAPESPNVCGPG